MEEAVPSNMPLSGIAAALLLGVGLVAAALCFLHHRRNPPDAAGLTATMVRRAWSTPQVGILLGSLFLLYFLASFTGLLLYEEQIPAARLGITLLIYGILVSIVAAINGKRGGNWLESLGMGLKNVRNLLLAPVLYLALVPFLMLLTQAWHRLLQFVFQAEPEMQEVARMVSGDLSWLEVGYILTAILAAPVYEELIFRGIAFPYLVKRAGLKPAVVLVSLLFALIHFNAGSFVPLALLSGALCLAYWRTGSLWTSIGMHMTFNAVSILVLNMMG